MGVSHSPASEEGEAITRHYSLGNSHNLANISANWYLEQDYFPYLRQNYHVSNRHTQTSQWNHGIQRNEANSDFSDIWNKVTYN